MPNWKKLIVSASDAALNTVTASNGAAVSGTLYVSGNILPDADNVWSLGTTDNRFQLNGGTPVTVTGSGVINYVTRFRAATAVETSSIFSSDDETRIVHSNDTNIIFTVSGSNGELFTVTDDNSGNLLEVNDTSGITVFEVDGVGNVTASGEISASGFNISNNITASFFTGSFTGSFLGTASNATTASHVTTASFALRASSASIANTATTASHVVTASFADNATSASFATLAGTIRSGLTASFADRATSASIADTLSQLATASFAVTASHALNGGSGGTSVGYSNLQTLSADYTTEDDSYNSLYGPLTVGDGVTVTVSAGSFLKIETF
jgi:hypothetical protein